MGLLLLHSHIDGSELRWLALGGDSLPVAGPLNGFPDPAQGGQRTVWLLRGEDALLTDRELPATRRGELQQAIPYALEDDLTQDPDECHFSFTRDGDRTAVVALDRERLRSGFGLLAEHGLKPRLILPDVLLLPRREAAWSLLLDGERVLVRSGEFSGFACRRDHLPLLLGKALAEAEQAPEALVLFGDEALEFDPGLPVERQTAANPLAVLAGGVPISHPLDLVPATAGASGLAGAEKRRLWVAAGLLILALALLFGERWLRLRDLQAANQQLAQAIEQSYRQAFPKERRVVNARLQMEQHLRELRSGGGDDPEGFLPLLGEIRDLVGSKAKVPIQAMEFRDGTLSLSLELKNLQDLDQLKRRLEGDGLRRVEVQNVDKGQSSVQARLRIRRGGEA